MPDDEAITLLQDAGELSDTARRSQDSLLQEMADRAKMADRERQTAERERQLREAAERRIRELEAVQRAPSDSDELSLSIRARGTKTLPWKQIGSFLMGLIGVGGAGLGVRAEIRNGDAPKQLPVAPVVAQAAGLEERIGKLERCLAAYREAEANDADFVEAGLELAGVQIPRREGDPNPRRLTVEPQQLINPHPGERRQYKITSTRPARVKCQ